MNESQTVSTASKWGIGVWLLYGGFVVFILAVVLFASFQDFELVRDNYYQKDFVYQKHLEDSRRIEGLRFKPAIAYDRANQEISFAFPDSAKVTGIKGTLELFRPSDATLDKTLAISLNEDKKMIVNAGDLTAGVWRVRVGFTLDTLDYYLEEMVIVER